MIDQDIMQTDLGQVFIKAGNIWLDNGHQHINITEQIVDALKKKNKKSLYFENPLILGREHCVNDKRKIDKTFLTRLLSFLKQANEDHDSEDQTLSLEIKYLLLTVKGLLKYQRDTMSSDEEIEYFSKT